MFDFPNSPSVGTTATSPNGVTFVWDGTKWTPVTATLPSSAPAGAINNVGRNLVHNSLFNIWQRGAGPWTANGNYTADRWLIATTSNLDTISFSRVALTDADRASIGDEAAIYALQNTFTGNAGAGANNYTDHRMENVRTLAGKTVTVSFYARCAAGALKLGTNLYQLFGSGGSPSPFVVVMATGNGVTLSTTWARYSFPVTLPSVAGKTLGTDGTDATWLRIFYSSGATSNQNAGNIGVQSGTIILWGVQLEVGSGTGYPTVLEKPDPQQDLDKCMRFFQTGTIIWVGYSTAGMSTQACTSFFVPMRGPPTFAIINNACVNMSSVTLSGTNLVAFNTGTATATGQTNVNINFSASADL